MNTTPQTAPARPYNWRQATDDEPLYVVNKTGTSERAAGPVVIPVREAGDTRVVQVENTWIPQDLSNKALPTSITRTMEFRNLVNRQIIEVLAPDAAEQILATAQAQAEMRRLELVASSKVSGGRGVGGSERAGVVDHETLSRLAAQQSQGRVSQLMNPSVNERETAGSGASVMPQAPASAAPSVSGGRSNIGIEVIDRYNRGEITLEAAVSSMTGVGTLLSDEEKLRLKTVQNLPRSLADAVAAL